MVLNVGYIKELLKQKDWSERKFAAKSGLSNATISRVLTGKRGAGSRTLAGIRKAFPDEPLNKLYFFTSETTEWEQTDEERGMKNVCGTSKQSDSHP